jgi:hypothetical protein
MIEPFKISVPAPRIPAPWKESWNIFAGCTIYPESRSESLMCLTMAPDFVLDFGWALREDGITYFLQINRGHFGWSDVVVFETFSSLEKGVATLQYWLDRLAADEATKLADTDLQEKLAAIDKKLRCYFVPPSGEDIDEILSSYTCKLILQKPSSWWQQGSKDASLQYRYRTGEVQSQLIFLQREGLGFSIEYHALSETVMHNISREKAKAKLPDVTITHGGAPWQLPANRFVTPHMAAIIICEFIEAEAGALPMRGNWKAA